VIASWAEAHLHHVFLKKAVLDAALWQILLVPVLWLVCAVFARVLSSLLAKLTLKFATLTRARWDDLLVEKLIGPTALLLTGWLALALMPMLELPQRAGAKIHAANVMLTVIAGFWALLRTVDIAHMSAKDAPWVSQRPGARTVLALMVRIAKIVIVVLGLVTSLQQLGYPVTGLIAGLGVGGLAVALAAQKTLENFLGSVMLSIDQPMRPGDLVQIDTLLATVEQIGLRSTRLRTPGRSLVTIPNGKLADARIENLSSRDRIHLVFTLNLPHTTKAETLESILEAIRKVLKLHPDTDKAQSFAHFSDIAESTLRVEVNTMVQVQPGRDFRDVRQEIFLEVLTALESNGGRLAFPSRSVVVNQP
jgi:MscS family membrane protein